MKPGLRIVSGAILALLAAKGLAVQHYCLRLQEMRLRAYLHDGLAMRDPRCATPYCDYSLFWLGGRLARSGAVATLYHADRFYAFTAAIITHQAELMPILYPPVMLPVIVLASLPGSLAWGYYGFTAMLFVCAVLLLRVAVIPWACIAIGLLGPAAVWTIYLGQFGIICGALLVSGLVLLARRPILGGILLACLCVKPQYAVLVPVVVLASRNMRAVLAGGCTLVALIALSVGWFGWPSWALFAGPVQAETRFWLQVPFGPGKEALGISPFWLARSFGAGLPGAYAAQTGATALAAAAVWMVWSRRDAAPVARLAVTVFCAALASPYGYTDDLIGYSVVLPMLARRDTPVTNVALGLLWLAPAYAGHVSEFFGFLPMPFCIAAALFIAWRQTGTVVAEANPQAVDTRLRRA